MTAEPDGPAAESIEQGQASWIDALFRKLLFLIPLGVMGNVAFLLITTDGPLFRSGTRFAPGFFISAMLLSIAPWFTGSLRILLWSTFLGKRLRYQEAFRIVLGAELGAAISPPLIGGGAVKVGMLMQKGFSGSSALSLAAMEGLAEGLFFLIMAPVALTLSSSWDLPVIQGVLTGIRHASLWMVLAGSAVACGAVLVPSMPRFRSPSSQFPLVVRFAARMASAYRYCLQTGRTILFTGKKVFALTFLLTAASWICRFSVSSLLVMSLGLTGNPVLFMALQVLVFGLMSFIPTPGGAGAAEAVFYLLHQPFIAAGSIGVVTMGWRFLTFYSPLLLAAILFLILSPLRTRP